MDPIHGPNTLIPCMQVLRSGSMQPLARTSPVRCGSEKPGKPGKESSAADDGGASKCIRIDQVMCVFVSTFESIEFRVTVARDQVI